jgi:fimbrial chaperone protein
MNRWSPSSLMRTLPLILLLVTYGVGGSAQAMTVRPGSIDLSASGRNGDTSQIFVTNDASAAVPVEITAFRVDINETGERTLTPAEGKFQIFPQQAELKPGQTQSFRIRWAGGENLSVSETYHIFVNQVPVKLPEKGIKLQVVFKYKVLVNVTPPDSKASIALVKAGIEKDGDGARRPTITVKNVGSAYGRFTDATLRLAAGNWQQVVASDQLRTLIGNGVVQPGKSRTFLLPIELPGSVTQITADLEFKSR